MTRELRDATVEIGVPGLNGTGVTGAEKTDIFNRITALEAVTVPAAIDDLSDVDLSGVAEGDLLQVVGGVVVPYTFPGVDQTFLMPFPLTGDGDPIPTGTYYPAGIPVPSACTITGWYVSSIGTNSISTSIQRKPRNSATWTTISASEGPAVSLAEWAEDTNLTTWTVTSLGYHDSLRVVVDSATSEDATISILLSRTLTL